jgi:hypothetical protein
MKTLIISLITISILLLGCNNTSNVNIKEQKESVINEEHHQGQEIDQIELNNGEKWKVDNNMLIYIHKMEKDIISFSDAAQKDYVLLSTKLKKNIDLVLFKCTMEGKAHEELHKWLVPFMELNEKLSKSKDIKESELLYSEIKISFEEFNKHFK